MCDCIKEINLQLEKQGYKLTRDILFDMKGIDYISSAGLRVLITTQKQANSAGTKLQLSGVNENVKEDSNCSASL